MVSDFIQTTAALEFVLSSKNHAPGDHMFPQSKARILLFSQQYLEYFDTTNRWWEEQANI